MVLYISHNDYALVLQEKNYPDLAPINSDFYSRFTNNELSKYNKKWTLFDILFVLDTKEIEVEPYSYEDFKQKSQSVLKHIRDDISLSVINNLYNRLIGLNRAPSSYPFNHNRYLKYLIVESLGGDIDDNIIPNNRIGAFYMLTPENYNTN